MTARTWRRTRSRYGWNRPHTRSWLGWTWGIRLAVAAFVAWTLWTYWP